MWNLTVSTSYAYAITVYDVAVGQHQVAPRDPPYTVPKPLGNVVVTVPGLGEINFLDIGDQQIGGFSKATWGVLISYQGEEVVFRYEGGGQVTLAVNGFGQAKLSGNGGFSKIDLASFILPGQEEASPESP
ncbi:MAG TPA: hypothetical protein VF615_16605 [Longimicrobiaceae bacterium]|jgi:hypothetical protein